MGTGPLCREGRGESGARSVRAEGGRGMAGLVPGSLSRRQARLPIHKGRRLTKAAFFSWLPRPLKPTFISDHSRPGNLASHTNVPSGQEVFMNILEMTATKTRTKMKTAGGVCISKMSGFSCIWRPSTRLRRLASPPDSSLLKQWHSVFLELL